MQFAEKKILENYLTDELMWCLAVFQHNLHCQYLPQVKEKLLLKYILCLKRRSCLYLPQFYSN